MLDSLTDDIRLALRWARARPGFLVLASASLALGLGANLAVFSVIDALLLRPFPHVQRPGELVALRWLDAEGNRQNPSAPDTRDLAGMQDTFDSLVTHERFDFSVNSVERTERLRGELVSPNYFDVLGVPLARGGGFSDDANDVARSEVIVSDRLFRSAFGASPDAVGDTLVVNGRTLTVVGVAPAGFQGIEVGANLDLWIPSSMRAALWPSSMEFYERRTMQGPSVFARLKAETTLEEVGPAFETLGQRLIDSYPEGREEQTLRLVELNQTRIPDWTRNGVMGLLPILGAVAALVFLMACTNVAGLRLVELAEREGELAVRGALGAGVFRLARQLFIENGILYGVAFAAGIGVAHVTQRLFERTPLFATFIWPPELTLDNRVLSYALVLVIMTSVAFSVIPAMRLRALALPGRFPGRLGSRSGGRLRAAFVLVQVGLSTVLLVGTGVFVHSLRQAYSVDPGYRLVDVLFVSAHLRSLEHRYDEPRARAFYRAALEEVEAIPGVESAAWSADTPFMRMTIGTLFVPEHHPEALAPEPEWLSSDADVVSPGFLTTMGLSLLRGRDLAPTDDEDAPGVVLINETLARAQWEGEDPVGKRIRMWQRQGAERAFYEVVGVVQDAAYRTPWEEPRPYIYMSLFQRHFLNMNLHVHVSGDPMAFAPAVRAAIARLDPDLPVFDARPLSEELAVLLAPQRAAAALFSVSGALALVLAALGVYTVVAYSVSKRTREIGLRMAMGAATGRILSLVVRDSVVAVGIGVVVGLGAAFALGRYVESMIVLVSPTDAVAFIVAAVVLGAAGLVASYVPARHAVRVDPAVALRQE